MTKIARLIRYLTNEPWWEKKVRALDWNEGEDPEAVALVAVHNGWIDDYDGCILPEAYGKLPHRIAHVITAFLSVFGVSEDGRIERTGELYSPAATFHKLHKRLGGHGTGAY